MGIHRMFYKTKREKVHFVEYDICLIALNIKLDHRYTCCFGGIFFMEKYKNFIQMDSVKNKSEQSIQ
jgi:hypothetical protein